MTKAKKERTTRSKKTTVDHEEENEVKQQDIEVGENINDSEERKEEISNNDLNMDEETSRKFIYNKFKNDGSFLQMAIELLKKRKEEKKRKKRDLINVENSELPKKKKFHFQKGKESKEEEEAGEEQEVDEIELQMKKEYLESMKQMEEQGLLSTDKGIGAGMVK